MCALLRLGEEWDRGTDEAPRSCMCDSARRQAVHLCLWASRGVCMSLYRPTHAPGGRRAAVYPGPFGVPAVKTAARRPRRGNHGRGESLHTTERPFNAQGLTAVPLVVAYHPG